MMYEEPKEQVTQMQFVNYLRWKRIRCNHSANEGKRTAAEGNKLVKMGMSKGFPDLEIPLPVGNKHGLFIEFKTSKGTTSFEQKKWLEYLNNSGYVAEVARSYTEAVNILTRYMEGAYE